MQEYAGYIWVKYYSEIGLLNTMCEGIDYEWQFSLEINSRWSG